jgi:hypothetical protein
MRMNTGGSSAGDFRSVIDDLTVVNKKLKQRLKKYERLYDAHLQEDKLFEVRFHGLPDHKKKELEATLRKFAADLDDGAATNYPETSYRPALVQHKTTASSKFAESGYASLSASGQNSSVPSNQFSNQIDDTRKMSRSQYNRQQQHVHSYLHDIPLGLLPNGNAPMTDKSKKKMVVRRLEQIFAGKGSVPGSHPHPMQQEEVAQSAATADRQEREATGQRFRPEGLRVARILPDHGNEDEITNDGEALQRLRPGLHIGQQDFAGAASPDQRPTRPLDLDPFRAQVPVENMDYIRHLGFTPPNMATGDAPSEGHGWLYLNLLINMAQLHTLNVTPEYVKGALQEYSSKLEISRDGRKVRWKGGLDVSTQSSNSSPEHCNIDSFNDKDGASHSKRSKTGSNRPTDDALFDSEQGIGKSARAQHLKDQNKLAYTPIVFRKNESDEEEDYYGLDTDSSDPSLQPPQHTGNSSNIASTAMESGRSSKRRRQDGPMIFYTKAKFCTDLSGDRLGSSHFVPGSYKTIINHPLGASLPQSSTSEHLPDITESRGPLNATSLDTESSNGSRVTSNDEDFGFSPASLAFDCGDNSPAYIDLEASGLGGVHPEDHLSIRVRRAQVRTVMSGSFGRHRSRLYPKRILDALHASPEAGPTSPTNPPCVIQEKILSASCRSLPSSALPPASFLPFDSTPSDEVDSYLESEASCDVDSESGDVSITALRLQDHSPAIDDLEEESDQESEYSDDSDDGSVDLLATARQLDPNLVRTQEREYDAALADRLAEAIPAGSSAATLGGGSGFNSPCSVKAAVLVEANSLSQLQSTTGDDTSSRAKLKRTRTGDSMGATTRLKTKSRRTEE